jgi:tetratricopeptide (TPR) repeat protein
MSLSPRRWGHSLLVTVLLLAVTGTARAQPAPPQDAPALARQYVDLAIKAQDKGRFDDAIEFYQRARILRPHPILLFNLGQAHRLAGHRDLARQHYRDFLATSPEADVEAVARKWLAELDAQYERERPAEEEAARQALLAQLAEEAAAAQRAREAEAARAAAEQARLDAAVTTTARAARRKRARWVQHGGLTLGGVGVIGGIVGAGLALRSEQLERDWEAAGVYDLEAKAAGERANRYAWIATGTGATLLLTGAVLYVIGRRLAVDVRVSATGGEHHVAVAGAF